MKETTKYLSQKCNTDPWFVDRLIISAFLNINQIEIVTNRLLLEYCICENDEDFQNLVEFIEIIKSVKNNFYIEDLIELFEFVISPEDRVINGAIYTPEYIREYIIEKSFDLLVEQDYQTIKISDIACGCGGFLFTTAKKIRERTANTYEYIYENNIYGLDLQQYSVDRTKLLLTILAITEGEDIEEFRFNIHQGDALIFQWQNYIKNYEGFNCILGNPPKNLIISQNSFVNEINLENEKIEFKSKSVNNFYPVIKLR